MPCLAYSHLQEARRTEIPFGAKGIDMLPTAQWNSDKQANYVEHPLDIKGDRERAECMKVFTSGPTASTGAVTASHPKPRGAAATARSASVPV
jgi:hypothetical protein